MTLLISEDNVKEIFDMRSAIDAMKDAFISMANHNSFALPRLWMTFPTGWLALQTGAYPDKGYYGYKAYGETVNKGARYIVYLYDINSGELLSIIDADTLTVKRTGAHSGIAAETMARKDAKVVGVLGTGHQAESAIEAIALVKDLDLVKVYSRQAQNRARFALTVKQTLGLNVETVDEASMAVKATDIIALATSNMTANPIISGDWFELGSQISAIGAVGRNRVEVDNRTFERSSVIVVDSLEECTTLAQEVLNAMEAGIIAETDLITISDVLAGKKKGRNGQEEITLFKSQGSGLQDVVSAAKIYEAAKERGLGKEIGNIGPALRAKK